MALTPERTAAVRRGPVPLTLEALLSGCAAALVAAALAWLGPPGVDFAAHAYQRAVFLQHGFSFWDNFWYAGRYSFVTYSVLYYPLAAVLGIRLLAVATIATATMAFAVVIGREWGPVARWSSRTFAVVSTGLVLTAAFPFALGTALGLLALWSLQARRSHWRFAGLALLTLAASPLAFLLLAVLLAGVGIGRHRADWPRLVPPAVTIALLGVAEVLAWHVFPDGGRYPFSPVELAAASLFCVIGAALTWRVERARFLRWFFVVYQAACLVSYLVPSAVGENIARLRFAAVPVAVLALSLRRWRPLPLAVVALALAVSWNISPSVENFIHGRRDPAADQAYWQPAIRFLRSHLSPSYRVEVVDTTGHWAAVYLPGAGIPLARGWFRQDDFPQNGVLYGQLGPDTYRAWLRSVAVRYVVLTGAPPDYSARAEAALLESGRSGLVPVFRSANEIVYAVPSPLPLVTGPGAARVVSLAQTRVTFRVASAGRYRLAVRYSPYWHASGACVEAGPDGMVRLIVPGAGVVHLDFNLSAASALAALGAAEEPECGPGDPVGGR